MGSFMDTLAFFSYNPGGVFSGGGIEGAASPGKKKGEGQDSSSSPLPTPAAPDTSAINEKAQENVRKRRSAMSQTVYTDPLGIAGQANVIRKTLTGQ